ncbi:uncharacterized protein LOC127733419 [Mytilus californianus]|uniref:uncharacterized protein LOC127733419 n=1 Tax=Mytilus californianus TaxID=6549 RepID=UPI002245B804|nr:uncharacterized protein LOC127733419 [Mytilus californianus]
MSKLVNRILNSDKEVAAVKYNIKEQRCLKKSLVTLDAEASYSVKLIDMENRGMKVFYRRFRDKVSKIKTHLKVNEITRLKDLEATGRLSPPQNTVNTTSMLRIADAEKRLKLQGREHLRKTKSAFTSRSVEASQDSKRNSVMSGTFDSHLNECKESVSVVHRPSTSAWDSKLNGSRESISKKRQSIESIDRPQFFKSKTCDAIIQESNFVDKIESKEIPTALLEQTTEKYEQSKCSGICIVYGETPTESNKNVDKEPDKEDIPEKKMSLTVNFIETGNVNSPRIMNKTSSAENEMPKKEEDVVSQSPHQCSDVNISPLTANPIDDSKGTTPDIPDTNDNEEQISAIASPDSNKNASPKKIFQQKQSNQFTRTCHQKNQHETRVKDDTTKLKKTDKKTKIDENKQDGDIKNSCQKDKTLNTNSGRDSPVSIKSYNKFAVPRTRNGQSKSARSNFERQSRKKSCNSSPERRSFSAMGKSANFAQMTKQYSCHSSIDKEATKMESRMSLSISDGLFCIGDDPYEERRQLLLMDEHNRFVILLHKKEEYLERIEEYIKKQLEATLYGIPGETGGGKKKTKSPKDIWDEIKHCRYLRTDDDEENIDLSQVVTLASEQIKSKQGLKYKPLFQKQKSKKTVIVEPAKIEDNKSKDPVSLDSLG